MNPYRVMATMVVLLVVAEASSAQFTATADIVHLDVVVTGPNQWFVPMLSADDFEVFEDGARHKIAFFSSDEVAPLNVGDSSGRVFEHQTQRERHQGGRVELGSRHEHARQDGRCHLQR